MELVGLMANSSASEAGIARQSMARLASPLASQNSIFTSCSPAVTLRVAQNVCPAFVVVMTSTPSR